MNSTVLKNETQRDPVTKRFLERLTDPKYRYIQRKNLNFWAEPELIELGFTSKPGLKTLGVLARELASRTYRLQYCFHPAHPEAFRHTARYAETRGGISRASFDRGIRALKEAGIVSKTTHGGKAFISFTELGYTILSCDPGLVKNADKVATCPVRQKIKQTAEELNESIAATNHWEDENTFTEALQPLKDWLRRALYLLKRFATDPITKCIQIVRNFLFYPKKHFSQNTDVFSQNGTNNHETELITDNRTEEKTYFSKSEKYAKKGVFERLLSSMKERSTSKNEAIVSNPEPPIPEKPKPETTMDKHKRAKTDPSADILKDRFMDKHKRAKTDSEADFLFRFLEDYHLVLPEWKPPRRTRFLSSETASRVKKLWNKKKKYPEITEPYFWQHLFYKSFKDPSNYDRKTGMPNSYCKPVHFLWPTKFAIKLDELLDEFEDLSNPVDIADKPDKEFWVKVMQQYITYLPEMRGTLSISRFETTPWFQELIRDVRCTPQLREIDYWQRLFKAFADINMGLSQWERDRQKEFRYITSASYRHYHDQQVSAHG